MTFFFCIEDILKNLENKDDKRGMVTDVSIGLSSCNGYPEDVFILAIVPKILDLEAEDSFLRLSDIVSKSSLYRINTEMAVDSALREHQSNKAVHQALRAAFQGKEFPVMDKTAVNKPEGAIYHPALDNFSDRDLCFIYVMFLQNLPPARTGYDFKNDILGKQPSTFLDFYDGYVHQGKGFVKTDILFNFGMRRDHDTNRQLESYVQEGHKKAESMKITEMRELLWSWVEADHYQARRCKDIHRAMILKTQNRQPDWVRMDVFSLLEKEAMKQSIAEKIVASKSANEILVKIPLTKKAIQENAIGQVGESLQHLLSQVLNTDSNYAGSAEYFAETAKKRQAEVQRAGLS